MEVTPEFLLNLGTHGVLLLVIIWLLKTNGDLQARLNTVEDKLLNLLDRTDELGAQLEEANHK